MLQNSNPDTHLFKLAVLAILILIFISVATIKIWELRIAAERVGVMHTIGSLRSAIGLKLGEVIIREGIKTLETLHQSNPMQLWDPPPINYLGEFTTNDAPEKQGSWYFDSNENLLIYHVRFTDYFNSSNPQYPELARYQLQLDYRDINNNQQFDLHIDDPTGLSLLPIDNYSWLIEAK